MDNNSSFGDILRAGSLGMILGLATGAALVENFLKPSLSVIIKEVNLVNSKHPNTLVLDSTFKVWGWDQKNEVSYSVDDKTLYNMYDRDRNVH